MLCYLTQLLMWRLSSFRRASPLVLIYILDVIDFGRLQLCPYEASGNLYLLRAYFARITLISMQWKTSCKSLITCYHKHYDNVFALRLKKFYIYIVIQILFLHLCVIYFNRKYILLTESLIYLLLVISKLMMYIVCTLFFITLTLSWPIKSHADHFIEMNTFCFCNTLKLTKNIHCYS